MVSAVRTTDANIVEARHVVVTSHLPPPEKVGADGLEYRLHLGPYLRRNLVKELDGRHDAALVVTGIAPEEVD